MPYKPFGRIISFGNPNTELRDEAIILVSTLIIISLVIIVLSCFG